VDQRVEEMGGRMDSETNWFVKECILYLFKDLESENMYDSIKGVTNRPPQHLITGLHVNQLLSPFKCPRQIPMLVAIFLRSSQNMNGSGDFVSRQAYKIRPRPSLTYRNNLKKRFYLQLQ
jgi:hypothetical protein